MFSLLMLIHGKIYSRAFIELEKNRNLYLLQIFYLLSLSVSHILTFLCSFMVWNQLKALFYLEENLVSYI